MSPQKEFEQYLTDRNEHAHVGYKEYLESPATAFLKYSVEAKDSVNLCSRKLPRNNNLQLKKNSIDTFQHVQVAFLLTIMGHFETFQRFLFSGMFDQSIHLEEFDTDEFFKKLKKHCAVSIDLVRLSAYRGIDAPSIGILLADCLEGWNNPDRVNALFGCFGLGRQFWSSDACAQLKVLWQLRRSIVHTGGTLSRADAQKVKALESHGGKKIIFEQNFIGEVSRKLHPLVKKAVQGLGRKFRARLSKDIGEDRRDKINELFRVRSSEKVWLR